MNHSIRIGPAIYVCLRQADGSGGHTRSELARSAGVGARFHFVENARSVSQSVGRERNIAAHDRLEHLAVDRTAP